MHSTMMRYPLTLIPIFERAGKLFGDVELVSRMPDKSLHRQTYGDFYRRARALGRALIDAGMKKSDRVATLMWNHSAHLEAYFGVPVAGGVIHTLNLRLHPDDLAFIVNHAADRYLIVDDVLLPLLDKFASRISVEKIITTSKLDEFISGAQGELEYPQLDENDPLGMCYTSGTTGKPKGVVYSHRAIALHSLSTALVDTLAISRNDTVLAVVPMFHANAWGLPFAATMVGAKQVLPGPCLDPESLLELLEREKVTIAAGVPTIWMSILEALDREPNRWKLQPGLRMVVGGSAAPEGMIRAFDRHGLRVVHAWGMTETAPLGTVSNLSPEAKTWPEDEKYKARAKQGVPSPFIELRAINERGEAPWDGATTGELEVRGAWVTASYYGAGAEEWADRFSEDGWFRTGDVASIDRGGTMKIADRTKDLIKSGGEWISSVELENALMGHPDVKEAAVIAVPHPKWAERPLAVVVLKEGRSQQPELLRELLAGKFAKFWVPDAFVFIDAIPRTSAGKFKKSELRERFAGFHSGIPG